jgi:hypothetical protein
MSTIHAREVARNNFPRHRDPPSQRAEHMSPACSTGAASCLRAGATVNVAVSSTAVAASVVSSVSTDTVGTNWGAVVEGCRDLLAVAFGTNNMDDTFEHACRAADRKAASRPEDPRILRARRLLADDDLSYERAYAEFMRDRPTPEATVDALVYSLRRGVAELTKPETFRRLSELDADQLKAVCRRVQSFKPEIATPWSPEETAALIAIWRELHG